MGKWAMKLVLIGALIWGGWWWLGSTLLQRGAQAWLDVRQVEVGRWSRSGAPLRLGTTARTLVVQMQDTTLRIPQTTLSTPVHWPGDARITLPAQVLTLDTPQGPVTLSLEEAEAEMLLHPGTTLQLEALSADAETLSLDLVEGRIARLGSLHADVQQGDDPATYMVDLTALAVEPGSILRQALNLPHSLPAQMEPVVADMVLRFDRPWDRSATDGPLPQPRAITVEQVSLLWGDLGISLSGDLLVDAAGIPEGQITARVQDWERLFDTALRASGQAAPWAPNARAALSSMAGGQADLDLTVTLAGGQMRLGFIPLGRAPRLILR